MIKVRSAVKMNGIKYRTRYRVTESLFKSASSAGPHLFYERKKRSVKRSVRMWMMVLLLSCLPVSIIYFKWITESSTLGNMSWSNTCCWRTKDVRHRVYCHHNWNTLQNKHVRIWRRQGHMHMWIFVCILTCPNTFHIERNICPPPHRYNVHPLISKV